MNTQTKVRHTQGEWVKSIGENVVDVVGKEMYYRNNSTGNATLIHFVDEKTEKTYCGFYHMFAENVIGDQSDFIIDSQCCKKCLKAAIKKATE